MIPTLAVLSKLLKFLGLLHVPAVLLAFVQESSDLAVFLTLGLTHLGLGFLLGWTLPSLEGLQLKRREGFLVIVLGSLVLSALSGLPYLALGVFETPFHALFEAVSGLTTTGASVLQNPEATSQPILLWRALTQWAGGMGFIILSTAILPFLGVGGMEMFHSDKPFHRNDQLSPRIVESVAILQAVYVLVTFITFLAFWFVGMPWFDALCHALTTLATGGFTNHTESFATYQAPLIQWITIGAMFFASNSFLMHYRAFQGHPRTYLRSQEFTFFVSLLALAVGWVLLMEDWSGTSWENALRVSTFEVLSAASTTGLSVAPTQNWGATSTIMLLSLMFIGGCVGSTSGGMKVARVLISLKALKNQLTKLFHPKAIRPVKLDHQVLPDHLVHGALVFVTLNTTVLFFMALGLTLEGEPLPRALVTSVCCFFNVGYGVVPGLGGTPGEVVSYVHLGPLSQSLLMVGMIVGRVELYSVLILFAPSFWRK